MRFDVVTLFPEFFDSPLRTGLVGKAIESGAATVGTIDPRTFTKDRHRTVDDTPYGGGGGMLMKTGPVADAIEAAVARGGGPVLLMSPQGRPVVQRSFERWARAPHLVLVAGRYEGFDERIRDLADEEVSVGDFVLTGGEYAALVIIDGVVRLLPGTLGNAGSAHDDSFSDGLLEHPQYTRPPVLGPRAVPDVLLRGHHADIAAWRHAESLARTRARRPDLLAERGFSAAERKVLVAAPSTLPELELAVVLDPALEPAALAVKLEGLLRVALAYGVARLSVVHPLAPLVAGERLATFTSVDAWVEPLAARPVRPILVSASSGPPAPGVRVSAPRLIRDEARASGRPITVVLGRESARLAELDAWLPSIRVASAANALGVEAAAAVLLDHLAGEG